MEFLDTHASVQNILIFGWNPGTKRFHYRYEFMPYEKIMNWMERYSKYASICPLLVDNVDTPHWKFLFLVAQNFHLLKINLAKINIVLI